MVLSQAGSVRRRRVAGVALALAVFLGGLGASWATGAAVDRSQQRRAAWLMDQHADALRDAVAHEADRYRDTLSDLAAAVGAQSELTATDFAEITAHLSRQRLPGVSAVTFAVAAEDSQLAMLQGYWRARGATGLTFAPVGSGVEHVFLVFSRTFDGTVPAFGRDLTQAPEPAEALRVSRITGEVAASPTYVPLKDRDLPVGQRQMSFLLALPIDGGVSTPQIGQRQGWMLLSVRGGDFVEETLRSWAGGAVDVALVDASTGSPTVVAATAVSLRTDTSDRYRFVTIGQRAWMVRVYPAHDLVTDAERRLTGVIRGFGMLVTFLLTVFVGVLVGARERALTRVDQATAALRDDIDHRKMIEAQLRDRDRELHHLAFHDSLTGLANRAMFYQSIERALAEHDDIGRPLAVLFVDLDGFKKVNDRLGHNAGDVVLRTVASRLLQCVRDSDTVARLGGDEFAILLERFADSGEVEVIADRVVRALQMRLDECERTAVVSACVGVTVRPAGGPDADEILHRADAAMYVAKTAGKNRFVFAAACNGDEPGGGAGRAADLSSTGPGSSPVPSPA